LVGLVPAVRVKVQEIESRWQLGQLPKGPRSFAPPPCDGFALFTVTLALRVSACGEAAFNREPHLS